METGVGGLTVADAVFVAEPRRPARRPAGNVGDGPGLQASCDLGSILHQHPLGSTSKTHGEHVQCRICAGSADALQARLGQELFVLRLDDGKQRLRVGGINPLRLGLLGEDPLPILEPCAGIAAWGGYRRSGGDDQRRGEHYASIHLIAPHRGLRLTRPERGAW